MTEFVSYKSVDYSQAEQVHLLQYTDLNGAGHLFGGRLVAWIDEVASTVARRHCESEITTASIDNLQFKKSAGLGDLIVIIGKATYVGVSSMEVRVDSYVEAIDGSRYPINRAYLTFVSLDENDRPTPIRYGLSLESEAEKGEWEMAAKRTLLRKDRKREGY